MATSAGRSGPRSAISGRSSLDGKFVDQVVHGVSRMALDLPELHGPLWIESERQEPLPEILVGDLLPLAVAPPPLLPVDIPSLFEAIDHVGGITDHGQRSIKDPQGL